MRRAMIKVSSIMGWKIKSKGWQKVATIVVFETDDGGCTRYIEVMDLWGKRRQR